MNTVTIEPAISNKTYYRLYVKKSLNKRPTVLVPVAVENFVTFFFCWHRSQQTSTSIQHVHCLFFHGWIKGQWTFYVIFTYNISIYILFWYFFLQFTCLSILYDFDCGFIFDWWYFKVDLFFMGSLVWKLFLLEIYAGC